MLLLVSFAFDSFDEVDCWFFDSPSMRYHVHSLGKRNSSSFSSVYWNRIERKIRFFLSFSFLSTPLSLSFMRWSYSFLYWLVLFNHHHHHLFLFSFLFRSFTCSTDRLNIPHVINLYNHSTHNYWTERSTMRKIRFRYIKENGKSTSVTVRCSVKRK